MDRQDSVLTLFKFMESVKSKVVKVDYDFDKAYPAPFSQNDHFLALIGGCTALGVGLLLVFL